MTSIEPQRKSAAMAKTLSVWPRTRPVMTAEMIEFERRCIEEERKALREQGAVVCEALFSALGMTMLRIEQ